MDILDESGRVEVHNATIEKNGGSDAGIADSGNWLYVADDADHAASKSAIHHHRCDDRHRQHGLTNRRLCCK